MSNKRANFRQICIELMSTFTGDGHECESCLLPQTTCEHNDPLTNDDFPVKRANDAINRE